MTEICTLQMQCSLSYGYCIHCKKRGVTEHPRGAIFYCFHGNPYCYHGNSKILLPWGVQLHRVFYSVQMITSDECAPYGVSSHNYTLSCAYTHMTAARHFLWKDSEFHYLVRTWHRVETCCIHVISKRITLGSLETVDGDLQW